MLILNESEKQLIAANTENERLRAELAGWKLFANELISFDPNNDDEIKDAATEIAKRFHEMKAECKSAKERMWETGAENEQLRAELAARMRIIESYQELYRAAKAELATARNDALVSARGNGKQILFYERETNSWSASRKEAVQLEGRANYDRVVKNASDVPTRTRDRVPSSNKRSKEENKCQNLK